MPTFQIAIPIGIASFVGVAGGDRLANAFHWRPAFMIVGLPGLAVAVLTLSH